VSNFEYGSLVKVINLEHGFLESRKRVSQINLKASRISLGCVGVGRGCGGCAGGCLRAGVGGWGYDHGGCYDR